MSTISEKLIQLKNIKQDIKQSVNNLGGNVGDDLSTYAEAIDKFATYENPDFYAVRTVGGTNYEYLFAYAPNTMNINLSNWDTSKVTNMKGMFTYCKASSSLDLSSFDTSSVTNMSEMFSNCSSNISGIENWDLSSLTNASYMFQTFTNKNTYLDLSALDFSKVSNANYMFNESNTDYLDVRNINLTGTTSFNSLFRSNKGKELDLSAWDISKVTNLSDMFGFTNYQKINLTGWNTVNVTNMDSTFYYMSSLTDLIIPDWDMTNATNTSSFIYNVSKLKYVDLSRSNDITISKIVSFLPTKKATTFGEILVPADTSETVINALTAKYWRPIGPKFDLISTELVFELDEIKPGKTTKVYTGNSNPWYGADSLEAIEFISSDESIATVNGREIRGVAEGTVEISARNKETLAILGSKTLSVSETDNYPNLIKFRTNGNEGTYNMIIVNGTSLKKSNLTYNSITNIYSYDPGTQITSIRFYSDGGTAYPNEIIKCNFNAANITDASMMFQYYKGTTIDLDNWDTSNVTSMANMFNCCYRLVNIIGVLDLSNLSTGIGTSNTFYGCNCLETLYLKNIYKNGNVLNKELWGINLGSTKVKDSCLLYIINELPNLYDKGITNNTSIIFTLPKTNTLTAEQVQPALDKGWIVENTNY